MSYTATDFVADQLKAMNPGADWNAGGVDRAHELAQLLVDRGVRDMARLSLQIVQVTLTPDADWLPPEVHPGLAFTYDGGKTWGTIHLDRGGTETELVQSNYGFLVWQTTTGHGGVDYVLTAGPYGWSIAPMWFSTSDWGSVRHAVVFLASVFVFAALPAAGISAGGQLGAAILGPSLTAQYPALASALGNALLSAAVTGTTDLEAVAKNVVLSYAGGQAGAQVGSALTDATTVDAIGKIGAVATSTFIRGGDVKAAVRNTLLMQAPGVIAMLGDSTDYGTDPFASIDSGYVPTDTTSFYQPSVLTQNDLPPDQPAQVPDVSTGVILPTDLAPYQYMAPQTAPAAIPTVQIEPASAAPTDAGALSTFKDLTMGVTYAMTAALQLVNAYQKVKAPPINPIARTVNGSTVIAATDNGLIQTRDASGRVTQTKPAIGQPQLTTTGNMIVNNGDGTFTLIGADGSRRIISYPSSSYIPTIGGGSLSGALAGINPAWLAAGVTIAFAVYRASRGK